MVVAHRVAVLHWEPPWPRMQRRREASADAKLLHATQSRAARDGAWRFSRVSFTSVPPTKLRTLAANTPSWSGDVLGISQPCGKAQRRASASRLGMHCPSRFTAVARCLATPSPLQRQRSTFNSMHPSAPTTTTTTPVHDSLLWALLRPPILPWPGSRNHNHGFPFPGPQNTPSFPTLPPMSTGHVCAFGLASAWRHPSSIAILAVYYPRSTVV